MIFVIVFIPIIAVVMLLIRLIRPLRSLVAAFLIESCHIAFAHGVVEAEVLFHRFGDYGCAEGDAVFACIFIDGYFVVEAAFQFGALTG